MLTWKKTGLGMAVGLFLSVFFIALAVLRPSGAALKAGAQPVMPEFSGLVALPPLGQLEAEKQARFGTDPLAALPWHATHGAVIVATLTDEAGVCGPPGSPPIAPELAGILRGRGIRFAYLPDGVCHPRGDRPASFGGFVDLTSQVLEVEPFVTVEYAGQKWSMLHLPEAVFAAALARAEKQFADLSPGSRVIIWEKKMEVESLGRSLDHLGVVAAVVVDQSGPASSLAGKPVLQIGSSGSDFGYAAAFDMSVGLVQKRLLPYAVSGDSAVWAGDHVAAEICSRALIQADVLLSCGWAGRR